MDKNESPPDYEPSIRMIAMPADANPSGDIFGGWIMSLMDLAGASVAYEHAHGRVVTVAVDSISFHHPVAVGDAVSFYAEINQVGNTSISTYVDVWVRGREDGKPFRVTEGVYTYVAQDKNGRPRPVLGWKGK